MLYSTRDIVDEKIKEDAREEEVMRQFIKDDAKKEFGLLKKVDSEKSYFNEMFQPMLDLLGINDNNRTAKDDNSIPF